MTTQTSDLSAANEPIHDPSPITSGPIAIIGGGVIGGGWAARCLLSGLDVQMHDPDPHSERKLAAVLDNARASLPRLANESLPGEGSLTWHGSTADAVKDALWVQECVPERLELKHQVFDDIERHVSDETLIASSTSGFKPSELAQKARLPARIFVAHPFNPVYLLPLVELVQATPHQLRVETRASTFLEAIGMHPLVVKREIDAHIADRLLEAVWREALWLVRDDIATTAEIDDAIRLGFGLRWAQMGLFETYRIAGGEAGMAHFIEQFGPCLQSPWTRLMDVPELDDALVKKIADQSDEQSGGYTIRELERIRDDNLVGILNTLKARDWGAGAVLNRFDRARELTPATNPDHPDKG